jgi:hypothetical protein
MFEIFLGKVTENVSQVVKKLSQLSGQLLQFRVLVQTIYDLKG